MLEKVYPQCQIACPINIQESEGCLCYNEANGLTTDCPGCGSNNTCITFKAIYRCIDCNRVWQVKI